MKKPSAYLEKWSFECGDHKWNEWIARNDFGNGIAFGRTRKECEADCRRVGYVPRREK